MVTLKCLSDTKTNWSQSDALDSHRLCGFASAEPSGRLAVSPSDVYCGLVCRFGLVSKQS